MRFPWAQNALGYSLLIGKGVEQDVSDACVWLQMAVENSGPGEVHDRAVVNLRNARDLLSAAQNAACDAEAAKMRGRLGGAKP